MWLPTVAGSVRERSVHRQPWLTMTVTEGDRDLSGSAAFSTCGRLPVP